MDKLKKKILKIKAEIFILLSIAFILIPTFTINFNAGMYLLGVIFFSFGMLFARE